MICCELGVKLHNNLYQTKNRLLLSRYKYQNECKNIIIIKLANWKRKRLELKM